MKRNLIAGALILLLAILQMCFILYDVNKGQLFKRKDAVNQDHMIINSIDDMKSLLSSGHQDAEEQSQKVLGSIDDIKTLINEIVETSEQKDNEGHALTVCPKREQCLARLLLAAISMREALLKGTSFSEQIRQSKPELIALNDPEIESAIFELEKLHKQKLYSLAELKIEFFKIQENLNEQNGSAEVISRWVKISKKNDKMHQLQSCVESEHWSEVIDLVKNTQNVDLQNWAQQLHSTVAAGRDVMIIYNKVVQLINPDSLAQNIG